ncbi:MAG: Rne/Rng family ribonuclease [Clostridia bacterium]|nr:Rne/Rng family ribonuclease [Clostridia bacterium]
MDEIIVEKKGNIISVCVLEKGEIVEKYDFDINKTSTIGNIYVGTIKDIFDGMQAAFVDIGLEKNAFLSLKDAMPKIDVSKNGEKTTESIRISNEDNKLSKTIKKGQKLLLQIRKEALDDKGPRVSTHVTLAGNYLVIMPDTDIVTASQKIEDVKEKERLLKIVKENLPKNYGCIIRTDACEIEENDLIEDLNKVLKTWENIKEKYSTIVLSQNMEHTEQKCLIYDDNDVVLKIARDMVKKTTKKVYVNDNEIFQELIKLIPERLVVYTESESIIEKFGLKTEIEKVDNRKIWLKCGAHIVIDKTEALTAVDVNSSKCIGNEDLEQTILRVNKEAAVEVMKQLRLKDIGGIIIIDFIDMHKQEHKDEILKIMREEQKKDRSKIEIKEFTQLNLVEMTRKKMYV